MLVWNALVVVCVGSVAEQAGVAGIRSLLDRDPRRAYCWDPYHPVLDSQLYLRLLLL